MKKLLLFLLTLSCCTAANAQAPDFLWAQGTGRYGNNQNIAYAGVYDIRLDNYGHLYTAGDFSGLVDFNPGPGVDTLNNGGNYLSKKDTAGNFIWVKKIFPGATLQRMAADSVGNTYFTGFFTGNLDLDPGPGAYNVTSSSTDIFICKLDSAGHFVWGCSIGGTATDWAKGITVDRKGNVYVTGFIMGIPDMDPGPGTFSLYTLNRDPFLLKLNAAGGFVWANNITGFGYTDEGRDVVVDNDGNVYLTGAFSGTADFDPGSNTYNLTATGSSLNAFVQKLDSAGHLVWAYSFGDYNDDYGNCITVDKNGNIVLTGFLSSLMDCDPGPGTYILTPNYYYDFFALKLTSAGQFMWAKNFGSPGSGFNHFMFSNRHVLDSMGNLYITGNFKDTADFDPGPGVHELTTIWDGNTYDWGIFLLLLDSSGNYRWATEFENGGQSNWGTGIQVDKRGNIYAAGIFGDTIDFDPGPGVSLLQSPPSSSYLLKFRQCFPNAATLTATACREYTLNGQAYTQSGTYTQILTNAGGCDSVLTLQLTVNNADTAITRSGNTLTAQASGSYQWLDCSTMTPVPGATGQQFTPQSSGSYALALTQNGCTDTSACFTFFKTGIQATGAADADLMLSPNPVVQELHLKGRPLTGARIYNMEGRLVLQVFLQNRSETSLPLSGLPAGPYLLQAVDAKGRVVTAPFLKQ